MIQFKTPVYIPHIAAIIETQKFELQFRCCFQYLINRLWKIFMYVTNQENKQKISSSFMLNLNVSSTM